jgi:AhpD family alkylhydroperoxidase
MKNPALVLPEVLQALLGLGKLVAKTGLPNKTIELVNMRASQINGCSFCLDMHGRDAKKAGETDERLFTIAGWREAPFFTEAERAALALTEAVTRISDREDPVPDAVWNEAKRHYDEAQLSALLVTIAKINVWNRFNVATRQVAGAWPK